MWNDVLALNRLARAITLAAFAYAAYMSLLWAAGHPVFAIRAITVQGLPSGPGKAAAAKPLDHVRAIQVAQFCVPRITGTFFTADLEAARAAFEALPWVRKATVRRQWPNRLLVTLEEHQALARWNDEDGNRFISVQGEAFAAPGEKTIGSGLPLLLGPEGSEKEVAQRYRDFRDRLSAIAHTPAVVALSPRQAWSIKLAGPAGGAAAHSGLLLDLGREQPRAPVLARLERFVTHYAATIGSLGARVEVIDLRYPNGFAARVAGFHATRAAAPATSAKAAAQTQRKPASARAAKRSVPAATQKPAQPR